jgi:predicted ATPase/DNA-binding SARP family transcriptional activator
VLEIRLLGPAEFAYGGEPFRFTAPPRTLPLLAWILLHRRAPLSREALAFHFWPDLAEEDAKSDLRRHLYYLTKALPPPSGAPWLLADKKTVGWNAAAAATIDLSDFERLAADDATLESAVALYRAPFLDGIEDDWFEAERERLQALAEGALLKLIGRYEATQPERALAFAQQLLRIDPWREDAIRSMMALRHRTGDRAGALREYREFAVRLRAELDVDPMPETTAAYDAIAHATALLPARPANPVEAPDVRTNLRVRAGPIVGRELAIQEARALLEASVVATLAGTGGVGKTRLAIEVAWDVRDRYPDGVWFVDLAPIGDAALVVAAIASTIGIAQPTERPDLASVVASIRGKTLLLAIDNCEHVVAEAARVVTSIVAGAPNVRVLATSREPLGVRGERVYRVPSLDVPPAFEPLTPARARTFGSVALFEERANAADGSFALDATNVADVVEICRRLDGIPLALELAAARVSVLTVRELSGRLEERFRVLAGGERTAMPRQRTMRATLDWSWDLCGDDERVLLRRVAVFAGGWTLDAMEFVCFDAPLEVETDLDLIGALVAKSLVVADRGPDGTRYRLLESLRAYAAEKLAESGERDALEANHARFFAGFGLHVDRAYQSMPDAEWFALATSELDNVREALRSTLEGGGDATFGARLASAYGAVFEHGSSRADRRWLELAYEKLERAEHPALTARLLWQIASISHADVQHAEWVAVAVRDRGDRRTRADLACWLAQAHLRSQRLESAREALDEAASLQDAMEHPKTFALLERLRGELAARRGDHARAVEHFERASASASAGGAPSLAASARLSLAELAYVQGEFAVARATAEEARDRLCELFGRGLAFADASADVAAYALAAGDFSEARAGARVALEIARDLDFPNRAVAYVELLALVAARSGDYERAAYLFGFTDAERARHDEPHRAPERDTRARLIDMLRAFVPPDVLAEHLAPGAIAGFPRAIAMALEVGAPA